MAGYRFTAIAQNDLLEIKRFTTSQWGPAQSYQYLIDIRLCIQRLADNPSMAKARPDVGQGVFSMPCKSHVIYYVIHQQQIMIFAVLHKRMIPTNHLPERSHN